MYVAEINYKKIYSAESIEELSKVLEKDGILIKTKYLAMLNGHNVLKDVYKKYQVLIYASPYKNRFFVSYDKYGNIVDFDYFRCKLKEETGGCIKEVSLDI
ncbi:hypothetical protein [Anaerofustis sp.]|uniref:hypothetical protein n=1 Tax=Anaerofustis sp. TaxID=1872517 RepID=UPI0025BF6EE6|nr:hypothetical protein [Anaerofustis sp.]